MGWGVELRSEDGAVRALIQKREGEIATGNGHSAYIGFRERGREVGFFEPADFSHAAINRQTVVVGGVPIIVQALARLGIERPQLESIPSCLSAFAGRRVWHGTVGEVRQMADAGQRVFVKPAASDLKRFVGHVVANYRDLAITAALPPDHVVCCAEPVDMVSEYRVFVTHGEVVGCKHYWGDFRRFPDFAVIDRTLAAFDAAPRGYAIDFAVTRDGATVLIEVNDGFALGSYGLNPMLYSGLLEARWEELVPPGP